MDIHPARASSLARSYGAAYWTSEASRIIEDPMIDLVYIASNHASHADYAVALLEAGKHVHIEKPHVVSEEQLERLCSAMSRSDGKVRLGFNRPESPLGQQAYEALRSQGGPMMLNWFVVGHEIPPDHWYFREEEGGRVLGNFCHWTDFVLRAVAPEHRFPVEIHPIRSARPEDDFAVAYVFADGSVATIALSSKGYTFEGVREHLSAQRGDLILALKDFQQLTTEIVQRRRVRRLRIRDHGHEELVMGSYGLSLRGGRLPGCNVDYVRDTARLFLETRTALNMRAVRRLEPYISERPSRVSAQVE
jgi:predicted dehydrogenase